MPLSLRFAVRSDVGLLRDGNEDAAYAGPRLLAIADGMGGHAGGEVASRVAIEAVAQLADSPPPDPLKGLRSAVEDAQRGIRERAANEDALEGMGTTLTAVLWSAEGVGLAHIGDSRAYLLREGALQQITRDHTYVQDLIDAGRIRPDEADSHPQRSLITRALDGRGDLDADLSMLDIRAGDRYLLCSDGLSGVVSGDTIRDALAEGNPDTAAEQLVALALRGGAPDNVTVIVADIVDSGPDTASVPVVVGAASDQPSGGLGADDTPAGRAALAMTSRRHGRSRRLVVITVVLGLLAGALVGGWVWTRSQYYLGVQGSQVAIYRGIDGAVAGVSLSTLTEQRDVDVTTLPQYERDRLKDGISAADLSGARRIADRLAGEVCTDTPGIPPGPTASRAAPIPRPSTSLPRCPGSAP